MKYLLKLFVQKIISCFPKRDKINYIFQKRITKNFPPSNARLGQSIEDALFHYNNFANYAYSKDVKATFFEFGAGWNIVSALIYYSLRIDKQILADVVPNIRFELVNNAIVEISHNSDKYLSNSSLSFRPVVSEGINSLIQLKDKFGISYHAPTDLRKMEYENDFFDFISTSATLECIPLEELTPILIECKRVLKTGGCMSHIIRLTDFGHFNRDARYHFFKYSDTSWEFLASKLNYKNRLRFTDYLAIFEKLGFKIIKYTTIPPNEDDIRLLENMKIHRKFAKYSLLELGTRELRVVCKK